MLKVVTFQRLYHFRFIQPAIGFNARLNRNAYLYLKLYDTRHSMAPRRGLYVFTCSVMATNTNRITVGIIKTVILFWKSPQLMQLMKVVQELWY